MSNSSANLYQKIINFLIYFFVFSICFERLTLFEQNLDFFFTKISSAFLIIFTLFDLKFWKSLKNIKYYAFLLLIYFLFLTYSNFNNRTQVYTEYFDYLFFLNILIFLTLGSNFNRDTSLVSKTFFVFLVGNFILTVLFFFGIGKTDLSLELEGRASIFGNNQNYLGLSLSLSSLYILYNLFLFQNNKFKLFFYLIAFFPISYFMISTGSRTAFLLFILGIVIIVIFSKNINKINKILFFIFFTVVTIQLFILFKDKLDLFQRLTATIEDGDSANRDVIWSGLLYFFSDFIFLGVGKTGYLRMIGDLSPHNAFLEVLLYTGVIGLSIFLFFILSLYKNILNINSHSNNFFPIVIFIGVLGILITGQLFDQKVIWYFMACLIQHPRNKNLGECVKE
jgi:O-antigen ligase